MSQYVRVGDIKMRNVPSLMLSSSDTHDQTQKSKQFYMRENYQNETEQNPVNLFIGVINYYNILDSYQNSLIS